MPRPFTPKVVTGNALLEGDVVYLAADGSWTRDLAQAELLTDEADAQVRLIEAQARAGEVVGVYLADMAEGPDGPEPTHFREAFRRAGPSGYVFAKSTS
ncbi:DUF2849 domain-containing protein [Rhodosalinus sediminis]|uniref:DUF2849 domain-containing protein n=1 Tax=Rhodosalinus sediminis TaxID=1940533 RepID=UPI00235767FA|nr:DUF2849 domain-containing protein [Rhodosalinus sediminis]